MTALGPSRIHITGGPGSGKTTLARRLAAQLDVPYFDLDGQALRLMAPMPRPLDFAAFHTMRLGEAETFLAGNDAWVSEGSCFAPYVGLYEAADVILRVDISWRVASYRILVRHAMAELAGNNRFPGLGNLWRFWRWCGRYYAGKNSHGLNEWGTPATEAFYLETLRPYEAKVCIVSGRDDTARIIDMVLAAGPARARALEA